MIPTAASDPASTARTEEPRTLLIDRFGFSEEVVLSELRKWVNLASATFQAGSPVELASGSEAVGQQSALTGPMLLGKTWRLTDDSEAAVRTTTFKAPISDSYEVMPEPPGVSTAPPNLLLNNLNTIEDRIDSLFRVAANENFEDGIASQFSRELLRLVEEYGNVAMQEIGFLITFGRVSQQVASEALRWLGRITDVSAYGWRIWLLEKSLSSSSPVIRDGAVLGLASMRDPTAIPYLQEAIAQEPLAELREDMQQVLEDLEAVKRAALTQKDPQS
ncbi:MAG: HEAT repeat domain-containing protein [Chloroflexi bacterium]|nr:HEAT repeat domain-containing protein [Chloroflexota bacterium]